MKTQLNFSNRTANTVKIFTIATLLLTVGLGNAWASNAHHCLIGEPIETWKTTDNWSKSYEEFALTSPANTNWDEFCIYMWVETNQTFAFNNHFFNPGDAKQVGPSSDQAIINKDGGTGVGVATDGTTNAWKYTGATGLVKICAAQSSGDNSQGEWKPYVWVEEAKEIEILKGNKIMFYFGMTTSWNENWNVLRTSNTTEKTADQQYHRLPESKCSSWISVAYVSPAQYYVGKTGWAGVQMESTAEAGCLYSVYNDGSDKIYKNVVAEGGAIPHFSTTMVNKTVGTTDSEIAATAETSIYGNEQVLFYYYTTDGGTTFTKFDPSDISSLAVGVYTVYALGWDGHILVRSDNSVTLNVGVAISLNANGGTDGDVTSVFATSGAAASTGNIAAASLPTKTGYTFNGFWTSGGTEVIDEAGEWIADVSGYTDDSGNWTCSAASTLYAHWTPKTYTVTLEGMEADSSDPISVNVTYDAVLAQVTPHTKAHYDFLGYWTSDDLGTTLEDQLIDANGNWIPDVPGYTGNDGNSHATWIRDDIDISLFADWTEHAYTITTSVSPAGAGTLSCGSSIEAHWVTPTSTITATANPAWKFVRWEYSTNVGPVEGTGGNNTVQIKASVDGTLTAVFEPRFCLVGSIWNDSGNGGMPGWSVYTADFTVNSYTDLNTMNLTCVRSLDPNKTYKFEVHDKVKGQNLGFATGGTYIGNQSLLFNTQNEDVLLRVNGYGPCTFTISSLTSGDLYPTVSVAIPPSHLLNLSWANVRLNGDWYKTSDETGGTVSAQTTESEHHFAIHNGEYVAHGGAITYTATPATGYSFEGWYNSDYTYQFSTTNPYTSYNISVDENVEAKFVEKATTVTLSNDGHGHVETGGVTAASTTVGVTTHRELTAVPDEGYKFNSWTKVSGDDITLSSTSENPTTLSGNGAGASSGQEVRANFTYRYSIKGTMNGEHWKTDHFIANIETIGGKVIGYVDIDLLANTSYEFAIYDMITGGWYKNGSTEVFYMTNGNSHNWQFGDPSTLPYNCGITTAGAGTYRFTWNITDKKMTVTYPNFVIYRTGDKAEDPRAQNTDVESYAGGTIEQAIEYRMKVHTLDEWTTLCLPFTVSAVKVWDDGDNRYYDIVPFYRTDGNFYTGHYIIRTPETVTNYAIETFEENWLDPESPTGYLPSANTPYIIQWHDPYFSGKYISFFSPTGQLIPTDFSAGSAPSADDVVNIYGNNTMQSGTVRDAYLLEPDYGPSGAWLREAAVGTDRTVLPFECFIRANEATTTRYRILRRGATPDDTPTGWEVVMDSEPMTAITVYTLTGIPVARYDGCSFAEAARRLNAEQAGGVYILRSENESVKLMIGGQ